MYRLQSSPLNRFHLIHGAVSAGVGSTVYIAGAGPVGLAAAASAQLLGAAVVIVGDLNPDRLAQARSFGLRDSRLPRADRPNRSNRSSAFRKSIAGLTRSVSRPRATAPVRRRPLPRC